MMRSKLPNDTKSIFSKMSELAMQFDAVNLSQGFPDFLPPEFLLKSLEQSVRTYDHQYVPLRGLPFLRKNISLKMEKVYSIAVDPDKEIVITAGATQALFSAINSLVFSGDEVIVFDPSYDSYVPAIEACGGKAVRINYQKDGSIDWLEVNEICSAKTKLIIVNTPNNPTGNIFSNSDLEELEKLVLKHELFLISDEVYEHIVFDGNRHQCLWSLNKIRDRTIIISSFGKTFHTTGWKIGYLIAEGDLMNEFIKIHQYNVFTVNCLCQQALADVIDNYTWYDDLSDFYEKKRNYFLSGLMQTKFTYTPTKSTYFQLLDYGSYSDEKDIEFAEWLIQEVGIATIPLTPFYKNDNPDKTIRVCFAKENKTLDQALEKLIKMS